MYDIWLCYDTTENVLMWAAYDFGNKKQYFQVNPIEMSVT